jgi:hypothetical protein
MTRLPFAPVLVNIDGQDLVAETGAKLCPVDDQVNPQLFDRLGLVEEEHLTDEVRPGGPRDVGQDLPVEKSPPGHAHPQVAVLVYGLGCVAQGSFVHDLVLFEEISDHALGEDGSAPGVGPGGAHHGEPVVQHRQARPHLAVAELLVQPGAAAVKSNVDTDNTLTFLWGDPCTAPTLLPPLSCWSTSSTAPCRNGRGSSWSSGCIGGRKPPPSRRVFAT